ncbi:MAG: hypothetical protein QOI12_366 [Alphaproteobacteria bacterium]|nr:hypothetical protein [Alphaproteobacteria bacterium]
MQRLVPWIIVAVMTLTPVKTFAGPAEDAAATIDRWVAAYSSNDVEALLKVYAPDGILQGTSEPQINVGSDAIRRYFRGLPNSGNKVTIKERRMVVIDDTTVLGLGFYTFRSPARFSFLVVKRGADWFLAHHHSSSVPAGRP